MRKDVHQVQGRCKTPGEEKYVTSLHTGYNIDTADGRMEQWQKWYIETGREEEPKCL